MLYNRHQTVSYDGHVYLDASRILCRTPELPDFEMLLHPLVEEFDLPFVFVQAKATSRAVRWKTLVRKAKSRSYSSSWYLTSLSSSGYFSKEVSSVRIISESVSTFSGSRRHLTHLYRRFFLALTMKKESLL